MKLMTKEQTNSWGLTKEQKFELRLAYRKWEFDAKPTVGESIDWWFENIDKVISQEREKWIREIKNSSLNNDQVNEVLDLLQNK